MEVIIMMHRYIDVSLHPYREVYDHHAVSIKNLLHQTILFTCSVEDTYK